MAASAAPRRRILLTAVILLAACFFHLATLQNTHGWGDDFAQYVMHAKNLAEHKPFTPTGYIYNKLNSGLGPAAYPPGYPLLITLPYALRGLDWKVLKSVSVVCLLPGLAALAILYWRDLSPFSHAVLIFATAFNVMVWELKETVASDIAFFMSAFVGLLVIRLAGGRLARDRPVAAGAVIALAGFLPIAMRTVGIVLLAAFALHDIAAHRRIRALLLYVGLFTAALFLIKARFMGFGEMSYFDQFSGVPPVIANLKSYASEFQRFWGAGRFLLLAKVWLLVTAPFVLLGLRSRLRWPPDTTEIFYALYLLAILVWPTFCGARFLLPLLPAYLFYTLKGLDLAAARGPGFALACRAGLALLLLASYAAAYAPPRLRPREGFQNPQFLAACDFLRAHYAPAGTVVVFAKPRALSLLTGLPSAVYALTPDAEVMRRNLHDLHATLVLQSSDREDDFANDHTFLQAFLDATPAARLVFDNGRYRLFAIPTAPESAGP